MYEKIKSLGKFLTVSDIARHGEISWIIAKKLTEEKNFPKPVVIGKRSYWIKDQVVNFLTKR